MEKRYQVFVSSTYEDLLEERQEVMQALLELDCIPSGMELFPAANEDQWTLIKQVINDCDYYMVIIGGRYGSIGPEGLSYTEMEYQYAISAGKPVIAFLHKDPTQIVAGKSESSEEGKDKLLKFRDVAKRKLVKFWSDPKDLGSVVSRSVVALMKNHPAVGWVRGDELADAGAAKEILRLRKQIDDLQSRLQQNVNEAPEGTEFLAQGDAEFEVTFIASYREAEVGIKRTRLTYSLTWNVICKIILPLMIDKARTSRLGEALSNAAAIEINKALAERFPNAQLMSASTGEDSIQTIIIQLRALGLIQMDTRAKSLRDTSTYWKLTPYGDTVMTRLKAIRTDPE